MSELTFNKLIVAVVAVVFMLALISTFTNMLTSSETLSYANDTFATPEKYHIYTLTGKTITNSSIIVVNTTTAVAYTKDVDYNFTAGDYHTYGTLGWLHFTNASVPVSISANYTYQHATFIDPASPFALILGFLVLVLSCAIIAFVLKMVGFW